MASSDVEIRNALKYDPDTGGFTWARTGKPAGCRRADGRLVIRIGKAPGRLMYGYRLAFILMGAENPDKVDHLDGDPSNDRWANLRACTQRQNTRNRRGRRNTKSQYKGASLCPSGKWSSQIWLDGTKHHIGTFDTDAEAAAAYDAVALKMFGEFARLNFARGQNGIV